MHDLSSFGPINSMGDTEFILAARNGSVEDLRRIFASARQACGNDSGAAGDLLQRPNRYWKTALHEAAQSGYLGCVEFLLNEVGFPADCIKQGDWTPLMLACTKPNLSIVQVLVKAGADLQLRNKDGWTPLHIACREGNADIVDFLLSTNASLWDTKSKNGRTPLHTAGKIVLHGKLDVMKCLLSFRHAQPNSLQLSVDVTDDCGTTPFMDAIRGNWVPIAICLHSGSLELEPQEEPGESGFRWVSEESVNTKRITFEPADPRREDRVERQPIHIAAQAGAVAALEFLVETCKCDVNAKASRDGMTPVHFASKEGHVSALNFLKTHKADLNASDNFDRIGLHLSAASNGIAVNFLLENGCSPNALDSSGKAPPNLARTPLAKETFCKYLTESL